jgi:hypothetical protein
VNQSFDTFHSVEQSSSEPEVEPKIEPIEIWTALKTRREQNSTHRERPEEGTFAILDWDIKM